jgi:hypothetical protein
MRGQAHTLEAVIGALLLLTAVLVAMQITVVTPLSASTSSQFIENQQRAETKGVLANAAETDWLNKAILYWDDGNGEYHNDADEQGYTDGEMPADNEFGNMLSSRFESSGIAYNVKFLYKSGSGLKQRTYINNGVPTDKAVSATRTVAIMNDDKLIDSSGSETATSVEGSSFFMSDTDSSSPLYKVVTVKVILWRN